MEKVKLLYIIENNRTIVISHYDCVIDCPDNMADDLENYLNDYPPTEKEANFNICKEMYY